MNNRTSHHYRKQRCGQAAHRQQPENRNIEAGIENCRSIGSDSVKCGMSQIKKTGVTDDYVRLSIGIEDVRDIQADLDQALKASQE